MRETSDAIRQKISDSMKRARANNPVWTTKAKTQPKHSEMTKSLISEAMMGNTNRRRK